MELQLGKQEHRMYTRVFDRTEEETCSLDAVVPDALGDLSALVVTEGTFCLWNLAFSDKSAQIEGCIAADVVYAEESGALRSFPVQLPVRRSQRTCARGCAARSLRWMRARSIPARYV